MKSRVGKNLIFQTAYQILITCLPIVTAPYLSRVLGAESLGIFSYTNSIAGYFTLFALLGVVNYGTREIAKYQNDREKRSETFWEIYIFQVFTCLICLIFYLMYIIVWCKENVLVSALQGLAIIGCLVEIVWVYFGIENFSKTVLANGVVKIISVIAILLFVKEPNDLWVYTIIMTSGTIISNVLLWIPIRKVISIRSIKRVSIRNIVRRIKPNIALFIPLLAMSVYHIMDKTMLGAISTFQESGFYYNADKIVSTPVGIINGFCTVMLPRVTAISSDSDGRKSNEYFLTSISIISIASCAIAFGIAAISREFCPIFFGKGYEKCSTLIVVLAPVLIIKGYCYVARMIYLIPNNLEKIYINSVITGAVVNLIANALLIPQNGAIGAALGTLIAEFSSCAIQYYLMHKYLDFGKALAKSMFYCFAGIIMFLLVRGVSHLLNGTILSLGFEVLFGAVIYLAVCLFYWKITDDRILKIITK